MNNGTAAVVAAVCIFALLLAGFILNMLHNGAYISRINVDGEVYTKDGPTLYQLPDGAEPTGRCIKSVLSKTTTPPTENLQGTNLDPMWSGCQLYSVPNSRALYLVGFSGDILRFTPGT